MRLMTLIALVPLSCGQGSTHDVTSDGLTSDELMPDGLTSDELMPDGTFEDGLSNWRLALYQSGAGALSVPPDSGFEGSHAAQLRVSATDGTDWHIQLVSENRNIISLQPNRNYELHVRVRSTVDRDDALRLAVGVPSPDGTLPYEAIGGETLASSTTEWAEVVHHFSTTSAVQAARVIITAGVYAEETYWFDSVTLTEGAPPAPPIEPQAWSSSLNNMGVESNLADDWRLDTYESTRAKLTRDTSVARSGSSSAKIEVTATNGRLQTVQFVAGDANEIALEAERVYELRFWAKSDVARDDALEINMAQPKPYQAIGDRLEISTTDQWTEYRHTFETERPYANARITIKMGKYSEAVYHLDDFSITDVTASVQITADYYVSLNGSDSDDGTETRPFRTIQKAIDVSQPGESILVAPGIYRETIKTVRNGLPDRKISLIASPQGRTIITGTDRVTNWTRYRGNIYSAPVHRKVTQVFAFEGNYDYAKPPRIAPSEPMVEARYPNRRKTDRGLFESIDRDRRNFARAIRNRQGTIKVSGLPRGNYAGAKYYAWGSRRGRRSWAIPDRITSNNGNELVMAGVNGFFTNDMRAYISGPLHLLDRPGEWAYQNGRLYFWPPGNVDPARLTVEAKVRPLALNIRNSNVTARGFKIFGAAIDVTGNNVQIRNIDGRFMTSALVIEHGKLHNRQADPTAGVRLAGRNNLLANSRLYYNACEAVTAPKSSRNNVIINNLIAVSSYYGHYLNTITLQGPGHQVIGNTVAHSGKESLRLSPSAKRSRIRYNNFSSNGYVAQDLGHIVLWGVSSRGTEIAYNWIHDNTKSTVSRGNHGIYLDNNNKDILIHHNVIWNIRGNAIRMNSPQYRVYVFNNTIAPAGERIGDNVYFNYRLKDPDTGRPVVNELETIYFANNFMYRRPAFPRRYAAGLQYSMNKIYRNRRAFRYPRFFIDTRSPAYNAGKRLGTVRFPSGVTFPPVTRFAVGAPDAGAYEVGRVRWRPGVNRVQVR